MRCHPALLALALVITSTAGAQMRPPENVVTFRNELPPAYRLMRVRLVVDGAVRYDGGAFGVARLPPGAHTVELITNYRMHSSLLSYLDGYAIEVRSAHVIRGSGSWVDARAVHNGGATTPVDRSAAIAWRDR